MPFPKAKTNQIVLATFILFSLLTQPTAAAPKRASGLKKSEISTLVNSVAGSLVYNARVAFVLYSDSTQDRDQVLQTLLNDNSAMGLRAVAEIASVTKNKAVRQVCLERLLAAKPNSAQALNYVSEFGSTKELRRKAATALSSSVISDSEPESDSALELLTASAGEMKILKSLIAGTSPKELGSLIEAPKSLENGSRYLIQSYFLVRVLALQSASESERLARFDAILNEVEAFLHKSKRSVKISKESDFEAFKSSLVSRYATLKDETKFSSGLRDRSPIKLEIKPFLDSKVEAFSQAYRKADRELPGPHRGSLFDFLSDDSPAGLLFRLQLKSLPDAQKASLMNEVSTEFQKRYDSLQSVAGELVASGAIKFSNPAEQRFFELMIENYFSTYSFDETANVMKAMIERPDLSSGDDLFRLFVMYAGPQMQKLLQVVGRRPGLSPELGKTFQALEDAGLKSPWEKMAPEFREAPEGYSWVNLSKTAFVGSMAETYKGVVRDLKTGEEITIAARTLKAEIRERVEREIPRLIKLAEVIDSDPILQSYHFPLVGPVMSDVMSMARAELDVQLTIENQLMGEKVYTATRKLSRGTSVNFVTAKTLRSKNKNVVYSTWLKGEKFEDFRHRHPERAIEVAEATARHWIDKALFNERFFHADLHQGNLKIREEANGDVTVGLLDFGMVGRIEKSERSILIRLGLATKQNTNATLIAKYLYAMSDVNENQISEADLIRKARVHLAANKVPRVGEPPLTMDMWMAWGMSVGLKLPKKITAFGRGLGTMDQLLISTGSKTWIVDLMQQVSMKHAVELAPDLAKYAKDLAFAALAERSAAKADAQARVAAPSRTKKARASQALRCEAAFSL